MSAQLIDGKAIAQAIRAHTKQAAISLYRDIAACRMLSAQTAARRLHMAGLF